MMRLAWLTGIALALAVPAGAAEPAAVTQARKAGLIGERFDGYIGVAGPITVDVRKAIGAINITRRSLYSGLAARRGATTQDVGITAGCTLLAATPSGGVYMLDDGQWRRLAAGESAAIPDYCR